MWYTATEYGSLETVWLGSDPLTFALGGRFHHLSPSFTSPSHPLPENLTSPASSCLLLRTSVPTLLMVDGSRLFCSLKQALGIHHGTLTLHVAWGRRLPPCSDRSQQGPYPPGPPTLPWRTQKASQCGRGAAGQVPTGSHLEGPL